MLQGCSGGSSGGPPPTVTTTTLNAAALTPVSCAIDTPSTPPVNPSTCSAGEVLISGHVSYDRVPHGVGSRLDYINTFPAPVRFATVQAIYGGSVLSTATDASGDYSICVPQNTVMDIRVRAEMLRTGGQPSWDFSVVDNTAAQAMYALQTSSSTAFDSGTTNIPNMNLHAPSGWDLGSLSYTDTRAAAPFAILDSVYEAFQKVLPGCNGARFPALKLNWSVNNVPLSGSPSTGRIGTSYFDGVEIYLLGAEDNDTDEYDEHVIIHEWGHYFEEYFSRVDSIGGPHSGSDVLDVRVAFSEGFGNAYSAMATDDPDYNDAQGTAQASGFDLNIEANNCFNEGWYNECSVQSVLYDLYDAANDDVIALGFPPLFDVLSDGQRNTTAVTSIFSFIHGLKQNNAGSVAAIDTLLSNQSIDAVNDIYGDSQLSNDPGTVSKLPLHETISASQTVNVCSTSEHQAYNGLGVSRFLRFNASAGQAFRIRAQRTSGAFPADPDIEVHFNGQTVIADSVDLNGETMNITLGQSGTYVIEVYEYGNREADSGTTCFDVSLTAI